MAKKTGVKKRIMEILSSKPALVIYAVLLSVIIWLSFSINIFPTTVTTISGIPVSVSLPEGTDGGSYVIDSQSIEQINIQIEANRSVINTLSPEDFTATADATSMKEPGTKKFAIKVQCSKMIDYNVISMSSKTTEVTLDKMATKEVNVTADAPGISVADGFILANDEGQCTPSTVTVQGPSQLLSQIDKAKVKVGKKREISSSYTSYSNDLSFYSADGSQIDEDNLSTDVDEFLVTFDIMTEKELTLTYQIQNMPNGFDEEFLRDRISLSPSKILLASKGTALDDLESWDIGTISLGDIGPGYTKTISIDDIPTDIRNVSDINSVSVTLDDSGLAEKEFMINDIQVVNTPAGFTNFEVTTDSLDVKLIGPEQELENLTSQDITATVNLLGYKIKSFNFEYTVTISEKKYTNIWAYGTYKASVSCSNEIPDTT